VRKDFLKGLNSPQIEAVCHGEGPILVLAGPGSGKTRVIAHRIACMVNDFLVPPGKILAVTFTNKAAREMKKRIEELVDDWVGGIWIGTFHSFCLRILKTEADFLEGYTKDFVIYDRGDQLALVKNCMKELDYGESRFRPEKVLSEFDTVENQRGGFFEDDFYGRVLREIYDLYKNELIKQNAMTFNDLLLMTNKLFSENEEVCSRYRERFSHVLVDEYQDTNYSQYNFVKMLSRQHCNLFVVGDDSQSIYGWRGADINNILNFEKDFPRAKIVKLERNYRSTSTILGIANSVIEKNLKKKKKNLWTENPVGDKAVVFKAADTADEAHFVANQISYLVKSGNFTWGDIAILYRANFQSRAIEEGLRAQKIAYKVVSGVSFYQRQEIKDVIAYLRLIQNPKDNVSFDRIVNVPPRKIGRVTLQKLREFSETERISLLDTIEYCEDQKLLPDQTLQALSRFRSIIKELRLASENQPAASVLQTLIERTGYLDYLGENYQREENVKELLRFAEVSEDMLLSDFLDLVLLSTDEDRGDSGEKEVSLMTVHAAKGLEFPVVFIIGINEDVFPHQKSMYTLEELEEERRLFYVAITRAGNLLYFSYSSKSSSKKTYLYSSSMRNTSRSMFLDDLPREHVVYESHGREFAKQASDSHSIEKATYESDDTDCNLRFGQRVRHKKFGIGVVKRIEGKGSKAVATVSFFNFGTKKILASFLTFLG